VLHIQGERRDGSLIQLNEEAEICVQHIRVREMCQVGQASTRTAKLA
jgi:hypothetical protein